MSRWRNWSTGTVQKMGFSNFLAESGTPMPGDPQEIAQQNGWSSKGYGWYQDSNGQVVARNIGGTMYQYDSPPSEADTQIDQGNPTPAGSAMKPADRARSMGLQSNGKGGYIDPKTGQVAARTVNNELVFYDGGPGGGAVSDGAGGQNIATAQPSWQDPETGLIVVPPAKPETPQELAAIPDPVPAQSPQSFNSFVQQKKLQIYADNKEASEEETKKQAVREFYNESPALSQLRDKWELMLDKANQSGDEDKMALAANLQSKVEDPDFAERMSNLFQNVDQERHEEVADLVNKVTIGRLKYDNYLQNPNAPISHAAAGRNLEFMERQLEDMEIDNNPNFEDIPRGTRAFGGFEAENEKIKFKVEPKGRDDQGARRFANRALEQMGSNVRIKGDTNIFEVSWDVKGSNRNFDTEENRDSMSPDERRRTAIQALGLWRKEVLPALPEGAIVNAEPMVDESDTETFEDEDDGETFMRTMTLRNPRAKIYQLAGFGRPGGVLGGETMYGLVVADEEGNKKVVPLERQSKQIKENVVELAYLKILDEDLNIEEMDAVAEVLFS